MKTTFVKILFVGFVLVIGVIAIFNVRLGEAGEVDANQILSENIEALSSSESSKLPYECYDKYSAYGYTLVRFRPCEGSCEHIWAYKPKKKTICPNN